jgi:hypothetical protein
VTVSKRFIEKLEAARDALSHSHPGADMEAILEAGLDLVIGRAAARKGCARPKAEKAAPAGPTDGVFGDRLMDRYAPARSSAAMA